MLWVYDHAKEVRLYAADNTFDLYPERVGAANSQRYLQQLKEQGFWLVCDCCQPPAKMFVRSSRKSGYSLVNHSEFGIHNNGCPFYTSVKGAPKASGGHSAAVHNGKVNLYRGFRENGTITNNPANPETNVTAPRVDGLVRLVWQLVENAGTQCVSSESMQQDYGVLHAFNAWYQAASDFSVSGGGSLAEILYFDADGMALLQKDLRQRQEEDPTRRHQALWVGSAGTLDYSHNTVTIENLGYDTLVIENVDRTSVKTNKFGLEYPNQLVVMAFTFDSIHSSDIVCHRWANLMCLSFENPIILHSFHERIYIDLFINRLGWYLAAGRFQSYTFKKPTVSHIDVETGEMYQPNFEFELIDPLGRGCEFVVVIVGDYEISVNTTTMQTLKLSEQVYSLVVKLEPNAHQNIKQLIDSFNMDFDRLIARIIEVLDQPECLTVE